MEESTIKIKIFSPFETYYEGLAYSLSGVNETGPFDVLYDHANFISLLPQGPVVVNTPFGKRTYSLNRGILRAHNNLVTVFANV
ncbi:MAG: hypothetical protein WCH00_03300 [Candidatus Saccharibacteria bacterium]